MPFTVTRTDETTKDADFETYTRLLRRKGIDLGRVRRTPDPNTRRRWLYVWDSQADAQAFANEMSGWHEGVPWVVVEVPAPHSIGPMGPILIQIARRGYDLVFGLNSVSQTIIKTAFPDAKPPATLICLRCESFQGFLAAHGSYAGLGRELGPTLTGLDLPELERLGYALFDEETHQTLAFVPPGDLAQVRVGGEMASAG